MPVGQLTLIQAAIIYHSIRRKQSKKVFNKYFSKFEGTKFVRCEATGFKGWIRYKPMYVWGMLLRDNKNYLELIKNDKKVKKTFRPEGG